MNIEEPVMTLDLAELQRLPGPDRHTWEELEPLCTTTGLGGAWNTTRAGTVESWGRANQS